MESKRLPLFDSGFHRSNSHPPLSLSRDFRAWWNPPFPVFARITGLPYSYSRAMVFKLRRPWIWENQRAHRLELPVETRGTNHVGSVGIQAM